MMRNKVLLIFVAVMILAAVSLTACQNSQPAQQTATEATEQLVKGSDVSKPEWTPIAIPVYLKDNNYIYATQNDFEYFAFVGSNDDDCQLLFKLGDKTAAMLREQSKDNRYYISIGEEEMHIGDVTLNEDCTIATLDGKGQQPYDIMTKLATRIRGL